MIFDAYDRIRIINLQHRRDRRSQMKSELRRVGLNDDPRVEFFSAIICPDAGPFRRSGSHGAFQSYLAILNEAAQANESVLILQDDCEFIYKRLERADISAMPDIFYGGYLASDPSDLHNSDIIGAHFMGFSANAAKLASEYLTSYLNPDFPPDPKAAKQAGFDVSIRPPIDGAIVWLRRAHPELVSEFALLSRQRSSRTDIADLAFYDRTPGLREIVEIVRALKGRLSFLRR